MKIRSLLFALLFFPTFAFGQSVGLLALPMGIGVNRPASVSLLINAALAAKVDVSSGTLNTPNIIIAASNAILGTTSGTNVANLAVPSCSTPSSFLQWTTNLGFGCAQQSVPTTAALEALSTTRLSAGTLIEKYGYYVAGDMSPLSYVLQAGACSLNTYPGGGDGFSQFPAQGGECWILPASTPNNFTLAQAGVIEGGTDPNGNNAAQINAIFQYNHFLHIAGTYEIPTLNLDGRVIGISSGVSMTSGFMNFNGGLSLKALTNLGGGAPNPTMPTGSGNWCPAMLTISTNSGVKLLNNITLDGNYQPVYLFDNEIDGLQQYNHIFGKNWQGSCGGPTPLSGNFTKSSPVVTMTNTTGYAQGQVIHGMFPTVPYLTYIAAVDANTDIVLNQPANVTTTAAVNAYNDSGGGEAGAFGNAGGQLSFTNFNEYQFGDPNLGNAVATYGNAYSMWPGANDIYLTGGLYENATCGIFMDSGGGGLHILGEPEVTNASWDVVNASGVTISGTTMTVPTGSTITGGPFEIGMQVKGNLITTISYITGIPTGGGVGTYTLSSPLTVTTGESVKGTFNIINPCAVGMADNAGAVQAQALDFGGDVVQITIDSTNNQAFTGGMLKYVSSNNTTVSPSNVVQIQNINQTNPNLSQVSVDPFLSTSLGGLSATPNLTNYGTGTFTGTLNPFNGPLNLNGNETVTGFQQVGAQPFSSWPACSSTSEGMRVAVTDSASNTWGATITGGGSNHVEGYCDGTNLTVSAK